MKQHIRGSITVRPGKNRDTGLLRFIDGLVIDVDLTIDDNGLEEFK